MIRATIWGREVCMQGSPLTLLAYRREFGGDLPTDLLECYTGEGPQLPFLMKFCWAMCATADPALPRYEEWLAGFPSVDLAEPVAGVIDSAVAAELFRRGEAGGATRARRWLSRRLGALARRLGA